MSNDIITNLHPDNDPNTNLYPNIKKENIPNKSISTDKLDDNVLSLIGSLKPSGTDTSTNILAFTSNKGIYVATDNGYWYYWNGSAYTDGGVYQATGIADNSIKEKNISQGLKENIFVNGVETTFNVGYIPNNADWISSSSSHQYTDYIYLEKDEIISFYSMMRNNVAVLTRYTLSKIWENTLIIGNQDKSVEEYFSYKAEKDCYVRISSLNNKISNIFISSNKKKINEINSRILELNKYSLLNANIISGKYQNIYGEAKPISGYCVTNVFTLRSGETIEFRAIGNNVAFLARYVGLEDDNNNLIENIYIGTNDNDIVNVKYTAKNDVEYLRASTKYSMITGDVSVVEFPIYKYNDFNALKEIYDYKVNVLLNSHYKYLFNKAVCIGDSLTAGDYGSPTGVKNRNYPYYLSKITEWNITNSSQSGATAIYAWNNLTQNIDYTDKDIVFIWLGQNQGLTDTLDDDVNLYNDYNDYANTNTGCYCKIIEYIKEQNPNIKINLICSWGQESDTGLVVNKIATKYNLPIIDIFSDDIYTLYTRYHIGGYHPNDITHFGNIGYLDVANLIYIRLITYISNNKFDYENVGI